MKLSIVYIYIYIYTHITALEYLWSGLYCLGWKQLYTWKEDLNGLCLLSLSLENITLIFLLCYLIVCLFII